MFQTLSKKTTFVERSRTLDQFFVTRKQTNTFWKQDLTHLAVSHRILKEKEEENSKEEFLLGTSWKLWTYSISDLRVNNLSKEGRALTVTNNYFWQPFNSQTYCPGSGQLSYGSIKLGQLRQDNQIKLHYQ